MEHIAEPPPWLLRWNRRRIGLATAIAAGLGVVGIALAPLAGDLALGAGVLSVGGIAAWAWRKRAALESLPLVFGQVAVRQVVDGTPSLRVRCWLGHGRVMREISARGALFTPQGRELEVVVHVPAQVAAGPITLTAGLPPLASGEVEFRVQVTEGGRTWTSVCRYALDRAALGPLDVPILRVDGRIAWDRAGWDRTLTGR